MTRIGAAYAYVLREAGGNPFRYWTRETLTSW
jgi:hypothetical protein